MKRVSTVEPIYQQEDKSMTFLSSLTLGKVLKLLTNFEVRYVGEYQAQSVLTEISNPISLVQKNL